MEHCSTALLPTGPCRLGCACNSRNNHCSVGQRLTQLQGVPLPCRTLLSSRSFLWGATLGITDKMEARSKSPLLIPQAQSRDEGVKPCNSDLFFLSSAELTEKNIKVLIVFERSMRRHKAFCSCAQRIIHKVNH